jgi:DNA polymerase (family X)
MQNEKFKMQKESPAARFTFARPLVRSPHARYKLSCRFRRRQAQESPMTNEDVVRIFEEIADMLEIKGEDAFRVNSYRRVARTIDDLTEAVADIAARGELDSLAGVGKSSAAKIQELLDTGKLKFREELAREVPESVLALLQIPGLGPKKAAVLWHQKNIDSIDALKKAIESGDLDDLKGFGKKSLASLSDGIAFLQNTAGRTRLGEAWDVAVRLRAALANMQGVKRVESAGSLRRARETVGDLDLLCIAADGPAVIQEFTKQPGVTKVLAAGDTKGSVLIEWRAGHAIQADLRVVPEESFGAAWQYFTGSKEHNVHLRQLAVKRGWSLNEYALSDAKTEKVIAARTEEDVYQALGLPWIPPELREDRGEFEPDAVPDDLITQADLRGDLHMHTTASDGRSTAEEMALAAKALGYEYICITDHSQGSVIANGLSPQRLRASIAEIRALDRKIKGIKIWVGAEVDILADGTLDYDDELLAELDYVVASVHSGLGKDPAVNTKRTIAAMQNPYVNQIGHPTGRMINSRKPMELDMAAVCRAAAETGTALEINAGPYRLDLKDQHVRMARAAGATIAICTDAHGAEKLSRVFFGVLTGRRGGLRKCEVLNTRPAKEIEAFVQNKRKRMNG